MALGLTPLASAAAETSAQTGAQARPSKPRPAARKAAPRKPARAAPRPALPSSGGPGCPPATAALQEWLLSADCSACWTAPADAAPPATRPTSAWRLDWIVPAGEQAPLSAAALGEAAERLQRLQHLQGQAATPPSAASATLQARPALAAASAPGRIEVGSGPAWQGYLGAQLSFTLARGQALPEGSQAWLALVERLPAGSEGSPVARALVRSLAGPLPLLGLQPDQAHTHLQALRWPEGAQPERLQARGWIEGPDGQVLLMAADRCPR